jgi:hypothetical protein
MQQVPILRIFIYSFIYTGEYVYVPEQGGSFKQKKIPWINVMFTIFGNFHQLCHFLAKKLKTITLTPDSR